MTGSLGELLVAAVAFVGSHVLLSSTRARDGLVWALGEIGYRIVYSLISIALLLWIVFAYRAAPLIVLWPTVTFFRHLSWTVMFAAVFLLVIGVTVSNPTGLLGNPAAGVRKSVPEPLCLTRHPVLWAIGLWAVVHALVNGDLASQILFWSMALLALGGTTLIDRKRARRLGADWDAFARATSNVPLAALIRRRTRMRFRGIGWWRLGFAAALYAVLLFGHRPVIGVSPLWGGGS
jgi:uncharacterized membrane protein